MHFSLSNNKGILILLLISLNLFAVAQDSTLIAKNLRPIKKEIKIVAVGDIMLGTDYPSSKYLPPNDDCSFMLDKTSSYIQDADLSFGNLEGALINGGKMAKSCKDTLKCYAFRMPERYASTLSDAGFDILSLANNHSGDFGNEGRMKTMKILDSLEIQYAGLELKPTAEFIKDGVRYGFVAFAPNKGTVDLLKTDEAIKIVKGLDERNDIVIVSFHGGAEGKDYQHLTKATEKFYGEDRGNVHSFAHQMVDAGADLIFGHGPHVTRAMEIYNERFIAYSLGNFSTYARFNLSGPNGVAPLVQIFTKPNGEFLRGKIISTHQLGEGGALIDPNKKVLGIINRLNKSDLPENTLIIDSEGNF